MNLITGLVFYKKAKAGELVEVGPPKPSPKLANGRTNPAYTQWRRANARAKGLCSECAKRPCLTGHKRCSECRERYLDRSSNAGAKGNCTRCTKRPAKPGRRYCQTCCDREKARWIKAGEHMSDS